MCHRAPTSARFGVKEKMHQGDSVLMERSPGVGRSRWDYAEGMWLDKCARLDSNQEPADYESDALTD
jgi:hypothetical protein